MFKHFLIFLTLSQIYKFQCRCRRDEEIQTVCGFNGITYKNPCFARCNNALIAYQGACSTNQADCGCPITNLPVCDLQGNIYLNECVANCHGKVAIPMQWCSTNLQTIEQNQKEIPLVIRNQENQNRITNSGEDYNYRDPDYDDVDPITLYYGVDIVNYYMSRHSDDFIGLRKPQRRNAGEIS